MTESHSSAGSLAGLVEAISGRSNRHLLLTVRPRRGPQFTPFELLEDLLLFAIPMLVLHDNRLFR